MKILKVELSEEEENFIFEKMVEMFDLDRSEIFETGQEINFPLNETIEVWAKLELYRESSEPDENNQIYITEQNAMMSKFKLGFFIGGDEIQVKRESRGCGKCLEDRIEVNYRIENLIK